MAAHTALRGIARPSTLSVAPSIPRLVSVRRYVEVSQLRTNNEVAGFTFGTVGVLYAVLLGSIAWSRSSSRCLMTPTVSKVIFVTSRSIRHRFLFVFTRHY